MQDEKGSSRRSSFLNGTVVEGANDSACDVPEKCAAGFRGGVERRAIETSEKASLLRLRSHLQSKSI